ncbi:MAG: hypothetical protein JXA37_05020 [Chloroflexia bacterium]|nr:hypothetical protein [Chloroflexia bacterium]
MAKKGPRRAPGRRDFWRNWGVFLLVGGILLVGILVFQVLRTRHRTLEPVRHYDIYFTQGDQGKLAEQGLEAEIITDLEQAEERIDLATPGLDLTGISAALIEAQERGVQVRVLQDPARQQQEAVAAVTAQLEAAGIPLTLHPTAGGLGGAFLVVDEFATWAGSWEMSRQAFEQDNHCVLRFNLAPMAQNFRREFEEMVESQAYGAGSPQNTLHRFISILDGGLISVYFTPEDDPLEEVLTTIARSSSEFVLLGERLDDIRLQERIEADARRYDIVGWAILNAEGGTPDETLRSMRLASMNVRTYQEPGRLRENLIVVDGSSLMIFSQPFSQRDLGWRDGYVLIVRDEVMAQVMQFEFNRLYTLGQDVPLPETPEEESS